MSARDLLQQFGPRESMDHDVVIVGGGPAGLATAIRVKRRCEAIETSAPKPVVAALHCSALGGGLEVALACDARIALKVHVARPARGDAGRHHRHVLHDAWSHEVRTSPPASACGRWWQCNRSMSS